MANIIKFRNTFRLAIDPSGNLQRWLERHPKLGLQLIRRSGRWGDVIVRNDTTRVVFFSKPGAGAGFHTTDYADGGRKNGHPSWLIQASKGESSRITEHADGLHIRVRRMGAVAESFDPGPVGSDSFFNAIFSRAFGFTRLSRKAIVSSHHGKETVGEALVKIRLLQGAFRRNVLPLFDNKCAVTGCDVPDVLTAAHILPFKDYKEGQADPLNGIVLRADLHLLFDRGLLTFEPRRDQLLCRFVGPARSIYGDGWRKVSLPDVGRVDRRKWLSKF